MIGFGKTHSLSSLQPAATLRNGEAPALLTLSDAARRIKKPRALRCASGNGTTNAPGVLAIQISGEKPRFLVPGKPCHGTFRIPSHVGAQVLHPSRFHFIPLVGVSSKRVPELFFGKITQSPRRPSLRTVVGVLLSCLLDSAGRLLACVRAVRIVRFKIGVPRETCAVDSYLP